MALASRLRSLTVCVMFGIFSVTSLHAAYETFYCCIGGNGTNPKAGVAATAWDVEDVNTAGNWTAADAEDDDKLGPGDTLVLMSDGGTIVGAGSTSVITIQTSGLSGKPITLEGDGSTVIDGEASRRCIYGNGKDYITLCDLAATRGSNHNINGYDCDYWIIENCDIYAPSVKSGIGMAGSNCTVQYNTIRDIASDPAEHCVYFFDGTEGAASSNNVVQYNYIHDSMENGVQFNGLDTQFNGNIVRFNWFENCRWAAVIIETGEGTIIQGNIITETGDLVYNGIIVTGDGEGTAKGVNALIYNNSFYGRFEAFILIGLAEAGDVEAHKNNAFHRTEGATPVSRKFIDLEHVDSVLTASDYNQFCNFYSGTTWFQVATGGGSDQYQTVAAWNTGTGLDANSQTGDPLFTDPANGDFTLQIGSPCRGTAEDLGATYKWGLDPGTAKGDFGRNGSVTLVDRDTVIDGWSMGAYEVTGGGPPGYPFASDLVAVLTIVATMFMSGWLYTVVRIANKFFGG